MCAVALTSYTYTVLHPPADDGVERMRWQKSMWEAVGRNDPDVVERILKLQKVTRLGQK